MKFITRFALFFCLQLIFALSLFAQVEIKALSTAKDKFSLYNGTELKVTFGPKAAEKDAVLLGRTVAQNYETTDIAVFETESKTIHFIPTHSVKVRDSHETILANDSLFPIAKSEEQVESTCMAYSLYNSMRQVDYVNKGANKKLHDAFRDESRRQAFIITMLNMYYIDGKGYDKKTLNYLAETYDVNIYRLERAELGIPKIREEIVRTLSRHNPILFTFDTMRNMTTMPYSLYNHGTIGFESNLLWTPKTKDKTPTGGHAVIGTGLITDHDGQTWIIIVDPNWNQPRLWKIDELKNIIGGNIQAWVLNDTHQGTH